MSSYDGPRIQYGIEPKSYVVDRLKDLLDKDLVILDHGCYICGRVFSSAAATRTHIKNVHGYDIPGRFNGVKRPLNKNYNYSTRIETDEYDEAHYACPSCWFHCPMDELAVFHDHTIKQHSPGCIITGSGNKHDMDMGTSSHSGYPVSLPASIPASIPASVPHSRPSSLRSTSSRSSSRSSSYQVYFSNGEEEVPSSRPSSRQVRISEDHKDISSPNEDNKNELSQKIDELRNLFHALFK
ncbi:hypothetical protein INT48_003850 [Thamnidium elegans]|uniref:C2H2-type domain-containing protein n=1 Tax=Thamnidium elegans TaxID=101142 RepID=A0A8H7SJD2_9FUNG|nr:hypothetical protein INT48_003850 [Thamnidium elegans]